MNALGPGNSVANGREIDVAVVPSIDDLIAREFSAALMRQGKDPWNALYLVSPDATYLNLMDNYDSSSSAFTALEEL